MKVNLDYSATPACALPPNGRIILCQAGEFCLNISQPGTASEGVTCALLDGDGEIRGNQWCYTALEPGVVTVSIQCTNTCGDVCTVSRTYTLEIDPNECDTGPAAVPLGPTALVAGDLDYSGEINVVDLMLLSRKLSGTARPAPTTAAARRDMRGDVNCDGKINEADLVHLAAFLFQQGPAPCVTGAK
jgi:hypothetical protein